MKNLRFCLARATRYLFHDKSQTYEYVFLKSSVFDAHKLKVLDEGDSRFNVNNRFARSSFILMSHFG